jgi:hypothetical protein
MKVEDKFKLFEIDYAKEHEEVIFESVITARGYLNNLHQQYLDRVTFNNSLMQNGLT